ncbi:MAG: hypothetical protein J6P48_01390 [Oscillospiraceae bacterium]|nr:hypothetical protein [Oscillospiraceae bacterium]
MKNCKVIWLDETALIASFHAVKGFVPHAILDRSELLKLLDQLLETGYRFQ